MNPVNEELENYITGREKRSSGKITLIPWYRGDILIIRFDPGKKRLTKGGVPYEESRSSPNLG
jgi:hypothetical protein